VKVTGSVKLIKQFRDLPKETHVALIKSIGATARFGERKAKAIVPVKDGGLKRGINSQLHVTSKGIFGFINFNDGTAADAIKVGAVNYGRKGSRTGTGSRVKNSVARTGTTGGYQFIETVKILTGDRNKRAVSRAIKKALKEAVK
tara:strand:- start:2767 stop:3201 length:435 start_codon:yes stop_codon:yes gene_type:complete